MARGTKTTRVSKSASYLINRKYMGDEPLANKTFTESEFGKALNWYNYMCSIDDARQYMNDYLKSQNRHNDIKKLARVPDTWISMSGAWMARMLTRNCKLPIDAENSINNKLLESFKRIVKKETAVVVNIGDRPSVRGRMIDRANDIIGDIEQNIDEDENFSLYKWLQKNEIPASYCSYIIAKYQPIVDELYEAYFKPDVQLKEAYHYLSKKQLKQRLDFFKQIISDAEKFSNVSKKVRKPHKKKTVTVDKILKTFKYQKQDNELKIASINPEKIIGSQELWVYNTRYKTLTVYRASGTNGLQVKGTSILGFDENTSVTKRIGRKPDLYLNRIIKEGKVSLRKMMNDIKTSAPMANRTSDNTILLRLFT